MGEKLQNLKPREAKGPLRGLSRGAALREPPREAKPFTRMAKWEIRFQRFALSFRPSALGHGCFRPHLAFSPQPLAFAIGANEKFHLSPACDGETRKFQRPSFQTGNDLGRMRSRSDGRCLFKKETFASHGCHSVERQQRHRTEVGIHFS